VFEKRFDVIIQMYGVGAAKSAFEQTPVRRQRNARSAT
jgi:hypothetical protein